MESIILMYLPGRMFSSPQKPNKIQRRRRENVCGWRGGGIRRLRGLANEGYDFHF